MPKGHLFDLFVEERRRNWNGRCMLTINSLIVLQNQVRDMLKVPIKMEKLMIVAVVLCLDSCLYELTFMPLQVINKFATRTYFSRSDVVITVPLVLCLSYWLVHLKFLFFLRLSPLFRFWDGDSSGDGDFPMSWKLACLDDFR